MSLVPQFEATLVRNREKPVAPRSGGKHSVLVVEDDLELLKMVGEIMNTAGFEMRFARSRAEMRAQLAKPPLPDLILLDLKLPDGDGFEILEKIREEDALDGIAVLLMTARAQAHHVVRALSLGADGYLTKPFRISQLVSASNAVLGRA